MYFSDGDVRRDILLVLRRNTNSTVTSASTAVSNLRNGMMLQRNGTRKYVSRAVKIQNSDRNMSSSQISLSAQLDN